MAKRGEERAPFRSEAHGERDSRFLEARARPLLRLLFKKKARAILSQRRLRARLSAIRYRSHRSRHRTSSIFFSEGKRELVDLVHCDVKAE